jgi:hypothetical protein
MEKLEKEWKTERKMHQKCQEEMDAEWEMRMTGETGTALDSSQNERPSAPILVFWAPAEVGLRSPDKTRRGG